MEASHQRACEYCAVPMKGRLDHSSGCWLQAAVVRALWGERERGGGQEFLNVCVCVCGGGGVVYGP